MAQSPNQNNQSGRQKPAPADRRRRARNQRAVRLRPIRSAGPSSPITGSYGVPPATSLATTNPASTNLTNLPPSLNLPGTPSLSQTGPFSLNQPTTSVNSASAPGANSAGVMAASANQQSTQMSNDYQLLLTPLFSAMTKINDHLYLTGVGGMTRENFRKNHIDFVVNITTEAPFWEDIESMRLPLEDDVQTNILPYMDTAVDRINEAIVKRNAHVLVHCVAGVSRSATIVIAYLMKYSRLSLRSAFNFCYNLRPVIRPNNGFMVQLINYELQLFGKNSVRMVEVEVDDTNIVVPSFFLEEHPRLVLLELMRVRDRQRAERRQNQDQGSSNGISRSIQ